MECEKVRSFEKVLGSFSLAGENDGTGASWSQRCGGTEIKSGVPVWVIQVDKYFTQ